MRINARAIAAAAALVWTVGAPAARADQELWWGGEGKSFFASATFYGRTEYWDWWSAGHKFQNEYRDAYLTIRPGLGFRWLRWGAFTEAQFTSLQGLPTRGVAPAPKAALGTGAVYYQNVGAKGVNRLFVKHAYAENTDLLGPYVNTIRIRGGRLPYSDGAEIMTGEPKLDWLKKARVSERLIGPFGWSAFQRSFDGVDTAIAQSWGGVAAFGARPTEGGFEERGGVVINRIHLAAGSVSLIPGLGVPHTALRGFYIGYWDRRDVTQRVDNTGKATAKKVDIEIHSFGADLEGAYPVGPGEVDLLGWGVEQKGGWYELEHKAFAGVGEAGFQFSDVWGKPHLRGGASYGSGDANAKGDGIHGTFFQILPTARKFALSPAYNMMNNRDFYAQVIVKPMYTLTIRADWHWLSLEHPQDRWYVGAGATQNRGAIFGYVGRDGQKQKDLGQLGDLSIAYVVNPFLTVSAYGGGMLDGAIQGKIYGDTSATYAFVEMELKL